MRNRIIGILLTLQLAIIPSIGAAQTIVQVPQGGTGWGNPGGITTGTILVGNGLAKMATSSAFTFSTALSRLSVTYSSSTAVTATDFFGALTGNASTATTLQTARTINGVSFDGSANITVNAASSTALADTNTFSGLQAFGNTGTTTYAGGIDFTRFNLSATSTGSRGINLTGGCFSINGTCITGGGGAGTVTSIATTWPVIGGTITTTGTLSFGWATTSQPASSNIFVSNGAAGFYGVATSTLSATAPLTGSFVQIGSGGSLGCQTASGSQAGCLASADWTTFNSKESVLTFNAPLVRILNAISFTGLATTTQPSSSNLLVSNGAAGVYGVATSTLTPTSPLGGSFVQVGSGGSITIQNAAADGSTKGAASFTAADFDASSGNISIDYTNGQAASATAKGFLPAANWLTFNGKVATATPPTLSHLAFWGGTSASPLLHSVATSSATCSTGVSCTAFTIVGAGGTTITNSGVTSITGTANQITASASTGAITLSLPNPVIVTGFIAQASSTFSSTLGVTGLATFTAGFISQASSSVSGAFTASGNTTLANATSTTFFATTASSTALYSNTGQFGALTAGTLSVSSTATLSSTLGVSGLATFTTGFISQASSTIGNGTAAGGLTVAGTASSTRFIATANGSASAPAFAFSGDLDTGLYLSGANQLNFVAGANRLVWDGAELYPINNGTIDLGIDSSNAFDNAYINYASTTATSATTLCLTGDICRQTWPTSGGASSTLLSDNNTWSGPNTFNGGLNLGVNTNGLLLGNTVLAYASSTNRSTLFGIGAGLPATTTQYTATGTTAFGYHAAQSNTAPWTHAFGHNALAKNTTGGFNHAFGNGALFSNTTGGWNTAFGEEALTTNVTGNTNTAMGVDSLWLLASGSWNTAFGGYALRTAVGGSRHTAVGEEALYGLSASTATSDNTFVGFQAGYTPTGAAHASSTVMGSMAARSLTTGSWNNVFGVLAGFSLTSGQKNVFIGSATASTTATGSNNIAIGHDIALPSVNGSNQLTIGNLIFGTSVNGEGATISTGNVGIASSSPYVKLGVNGETVATNFTADSTTATSTFPRSSFTVGISILGEYFTNFTTYVRSLFTGGRSLTVASGQFDADAELYTTSLTFNYASSTLATSTTPVLYKLIPQAFTVTTITCWDGSNSPVGTSTIMFEERTLPNTAGTDVLYGLGIVAGSGVPTASSTVANNSLASGSYLAMLVEGYLLGTPDFPVCDVKGTWND